jgi:dipeptidyl aminopeptidase/acylaminoacyl peptidase
MSASRTIDVDILWRLQRIGNPALAPDGAHAVCAVTSYSMQDNRGSTSLWLLPTDRRAPRRLTRCGDKDGQPAWSPHGDRIAFIAKREQQGQKDSTAQLYLIDAAEVRRACQRLRPGIEAFSGCPMAAVCSSWPGSGPN